MEKQQKHLYELEFSVEVSTIYHDWRRASLESWSGLVRAVTLIGAIVALVTSFAALNNTNLIFAVAIANIAVASVALSDLIFRIDHRARVHTDLYQRFKRLQAVIASRRDEASKLAGEWDAEAQLIRVDEPVVLWAVYAQAWNQALGKRKVSSDQFRQISMFQTFFGRFIAYRPQDFPLVKSHS